MEEIKPCPFCGGNAKSYRTRDDFFNAGRVRCDNDECYIKPVAKGLDEAAAISIWNIRKGEE